MNFLLLRPKAYECKSMARKVKIRKKTAFYLWFANSYIKIPPATDALSEFI